MQSGNGGATSALAVGAEATPARANPAASTRIASSATAGRLPPPMPVRRSPIDPPLAHAITTWRVDRTGVRAASDAGGAYRRGGDGGGRPAAVGHPYPAARTTARCADRPLLRTGGLR